MKMVVLGAGRQGCAAAFDLARSPLVEDVTLVDLGLDELPAFLRGDAKVRLLRSDVNDLLRARELIAPATVVCSALPYHMNFRVAELALECGTHYCDLGGNTEIVKQQRGLDAAAVEAGVSLVPDCGLAPGLVNILAASGIRSLDSVDSVRIRVGGLPQKPLPPLHYGIVYSLEGLLDYYTTNSVVLRNGVPQWVDALSGLETCKFPAPVGELEAFHTAGGISSLAERYAGQVREMDYKTLRFPGHAAIMKAVRDLGLLGLDPVRVGAHSVVPREAFAAIVTPHLSGVSLDFVVARVTVAGLLDGKPHALEWEMIDYCDEQNGITAMMRTTGYSLAITALLQATGAIPAGVRTPDEGVPVDAFLGELAARGIEVGAKAVELPVHSQG
ncbi:MAG: saccharopine dehydrogenase NADP-binding domain-containing protein [Rhodocyclaceae bacterium]|nr:saccharopine dehydrogenase NADP-binding domain-containing protein [Rhodocyclaceae bacterium]